MATEASLIHAEITNAITELLQFLQRYPENSLFLVPVLPAFRITRRAIANFGKKLPKKDIEWCQKWQTIEPPEDSTADDTTRDNPSIANATTQDNSSTTDVTTQDNSSTTDFTTQGNSSAADATTQDNSSTANATTQDNSSAADAATQQNFSTVDTQNNIPAPQDTFLPKKKQRSYKPLGIIDDKVITKFKGKEDEFNLWTHHPDSFWKLPEAQARPEAVLSERSFFENTAEQPKEIESLKLIHRLDSVIAYLRYKKRMPLKQMVQLRDVETFLKVIGLPIEQAKKQQSILLSGRRRLQFCHLLSENNVEFPKACYDDINFNDIDYGVLFLDIDDKLWDSTQGKHYALMFKTVEDLERWDIVRSSERFKANSAAKAALRYRQASIESSAPTPPSNDKENNSTTAPSDVEGSSSIVVSEDTEDHLDNTRTLKRLRTEDHLDSTTASKRLRIEENPDGSRASEHARTEENPDGTEENLDGTRALERTDGNMGVLLQAVELTGRNADTETTIANLDLPMEQSDTAAMNSTIDDIYDKLTISYDDGQPLFDGHVLWDNIDINEINVAELLHTSSELENIG